MNCTGTVTCIHTTPVTRPCVWIGCSDKTTVVATRERLKSWRVQSEWVAFGTDHDRRKEGSLGKHGFSHRRRESKMVASWQATGETTAPPQRRTHGMCLLRTSGLQRAQTIFAGGRCLTAAPTTHACLKKVSNRHFLQQVWQSSLICIFYYQFHY